MYRDNSIYLRKKDRDRNNFQNGDTSIKDQYNIKLITSLVLNDRNVI